MTRIARTVLSGALALAVGAAAYASEPEQTKEGTPAPTTPAPKVMKKKKIEWSPGAARDTTFLTPPKGEEGRLWMYVSGEVVNLYCYLNHGSTGEIHRKCAVARTRGGVPTGLLTQLGLLTRQGEIYVLFPNHEWAMDKEQATYAKPYQQLVDWTARQVQAGGFLVERKGMKGIEIIESRLLPAEGGPDSSAVQAPASTGSEAP